MENTRRATVARGTGRDVLLDATLRLIGDRGLHAITLREVAGAAGLSLGSTTYHFADRDALLIAALSRFADTVSDHCDKAIDRSAYEGKSGRDIMRDVFAEMGTFYCETTWMLAQLETYTEAARSTEVAAVSERVLDAYRRLLTHAFTAAGLPADDVPARVSRVLTYADGLALQSAAKGTPCTLADDASAVIWMLATTSV
ncbi:TetR/AcrR family transcriptional regulator [Williamsia deligens]|uniref:TetR/AcrR family transcriptional regulator n=1 Tax=Williamsia deligens TaxID=321325 RepID=A0ABW3G290_9NOCA|nr:TetR family transcriptional regulator [Williamsia deligens]MCP2194879.1 transcriptional regulator, TetR family [Williamsia deligens]